MAAKPDLRLVLDFLRELRDHNAREWFLENKGRYETARAAFQAIVGELLGRFEPDGLSMLAGGLEGESLKTAPQGYAKDHPDIELLRMKQYIATHRLSDEAVVDADLVSNALKVFKTMKPFEAYLESVLE